MSYNYVYPGKCIILMRRRNVATRFQPVPTVDDKWRACVRVCIRVSLQLISTNIFSLANTWIQQFLDLYKYSKLCSLVPAQKYPSSNL